MARTIEWTRTAWEDLEQIADYIARDPTHYAAAFVREVRNAVVVLSDFADMGRVVPELGDPAIREIFIKKYRLLYRVSPDGISIVAFVHGARDLSALWEREGR